LALEVTDQRLPGQRVRTETTPYFPRLHQQPVVAVQPKAATLETVEALVAVALTLAGRVEQEQQIKEGLAVLVLRTLRVVELLVAVAVGHQEQAHLHPTLTTEGLAELV
jgi:hydrogenase-4 membrane subunit HyfE